MKSKQLDLYKGKRSDEWQTPNFLWEWLNFIYRFQFDLAASQTNKKVDNYFSKKNNALIHNWSFIQGYSWMNPPFSLAEEFFKKASESKNPIVAIYKCSNMETKTWQKYILPHALVHVLDKRVNYEIPNEPKRNGVPFASALILYRVKKGLNQLPSGITLKCLKSN